MTQSFQPQEIERLIDLVEAVIGELPLYLEGISELDDRLLFSLEHITDGDCWFTLPVQAMHLSDGALWVLVDREIERILDILWERVDVE